MPVKASYLAIAGIGGIFLWSGLKGKSVSSVLRNLIAGNQPGTASSANTIQGFGSGTSGASGTVPASTVSPAAVGSYKAYALALLTARGWAGQWSSFSSIVNAEDGSWNPKAQNPSGAFGIAQALGHGTAGTAGTVDGVTINEYGNFGTSDATCRAANSASGYAQLQWMVNYIQEKYGDPDQAWAYHVANGFY